MVENRCYDADCADENCRNPEHYNYICFDPECKDVRCEDPKHYDKQLLRDYQKNTDLSVYDHREEIDYDEDVGGEYLHLFSHEVDCAYEINSTYYKDFATEYANNLLAAGFYETSENPWGLSCFHHDETNINIRIVYNEELVDLFIFRNL